MGTFGGPHSVTADDREVVKRVLDGNTDDFRLLVDRHQQSILRFATGLLHNREEALDATQDVFLAAFANLCHYWSSRGAFSTWLYTIARNRCLNLIRRNLPVLLDQPALVEDVVTADALANRELHLRLDKALATLPIERRSHSGQEAPAAPPTPRTR